MRKSRFLTLFLTIVFVLANVTIPSFAADDPFVYGAPGSFIAKSASKTGAVYDASKTMIPVLPAPVGNLPYHIAYTHEDGARYALVNSTVHASIDAETGLLSLTPNATYTAVYQRDADITVQIFDDSDEQIWRADAGTHTSKHKIPAVMSGYNFTFDDANSTPEASGTFDSANAKSVIGGTETLSLATESGRTYGYAATGSLYLNPYSAFRRIDGTASAYFNCYMPFVFEMELKDLSTSIGSLQDGGVNLIGISGNKIDTTWKNTAGTTAGTNFDFDNFTTDGWHHYKWIIRPHTRDSIDGTTSYTEGFDLYIDDQLVLKNVSTDMKSTSTPLTFTANGVDSVKSYGTTLGFAYDVSLASEGNEIGNTLTATAAYQDLPGNVPEAVEYAFAVANEEGGDYEILSDGDYTVNSDSNNATYTILDKHNGKFIYAAARVKEQEIHDCATEWVLSEDYIQVGAEASSTPAVAITVNGEDKDITAENIIPDSGSAAIAITINEVPAGADKFILAQYAKVDSKPVLKSVVATANTTLSLPAADLSADSEFKLFMLTEVGLIPKNVISFK